MVEYLRRYTGAAEEKDNEIVVVRAVIGTFHCGCCAKGFGILKAPAKAFNKIE